MILPHTVGGEAAATRLFKWWDEEGKEFVFNPRISSLSLYPCLKLAEINPQSVPRFTLMCKASVCVCVCVCVCIPSCNLQEMNLHVWFSLHFFLCINFSLSLLIIIMIMILTIFALQILSKIDFGQTSSPAGILEVCDGTKTSHSFKRVSVCV